jgi:hypothetical protein
MSKTHSQVEEMIVTIEEVMGATYEGVTPGPNPIYLFMYKSTGQQLTYTREQLTDSYSYCLLFTDTKR